jgi:cation diffusion facilitator CzcD-associated flavoprotein CzcO
MTIINTTNNNATANETRYAVQETPLGSTRPIRVIAIGAGASGLNLAHQVNKHMSNIELTIYEKNPEVGGTWYENRYPGCACDIPSHNYQFTWAPNPDWSALYVQPFLLWC